MIALLLGLFRTDLLAREMSAVTLVMDILGQRREERTKAQQSAWQCTGHDLQPRLVPKCKCNKIQLPDGLQLSYVSIKQQLKGNAAELGRIFYSLHYSRLCHRISALLLHALVKLSPLLREFTHEEQQRTAEP